MKFDELFKSTNINIALCDTYPQLVIQSLIDKKEKFTATYKQNGVNLKGTIHNQTEADALVDFLKILNEKRDVKNDKQSTSGSCQCGTDDWELVSLLDIFEGLLCGGMFLILQCNSCKRTIEVNVGNRYPK